MSAAFILDCSVTMAWCFSDESKPATTALLDRLVSESTLVPAHWFLEVVNVLAMAEKRKRITPAKSAEFLDQLSRLPIDVDDEVPGRAFAHLFPLCRDHGLTSYDAAYLDLAIRRRLPLATTDKDLRSAAKAVGVVVLGA